MDKWEKDIHSIPEIDKFKEGRHSGNRKAMIHNKMRTVCVNSKCLHCLIHILIASSVFFLRKYDLCSPLCARMSVHISILNLPSPLLCGSNPRSIKPQPCRYKLSQIAGDQWRLSVLWAAFWRCHVSCSIQQMALMKYANSYYKPDDVAL